MYFLAKRFLLEQKGNKGRKKVENIKVSRSAVKLWS